METTQQTTAEPTEPTLDDVYREAGLSEPTQPTQAQPAPTQAQPTQPSEPAAPRLPDPQDPEGMRQYMASRDQGQTELTKAVKVMAGHLTLQSQREAQAKLETDIKSAVETVNDIVQHPKPKVIEAMIDAEARSDYRFKALWENRHKNPAAFNKALGVIAKRFQEDLSVKVDPKLTDAQRQRKLAQSAMATTAPDENEGDTRFNDPATFDQEWEKLVRPAG